MNRDRLVVHCALALMIVVCGPLGAQETPSGQSPSSSTANFDVRLRNHEPTFLGYTQDSDDQAFMDFTISLQYPLFADSLSDGANRFKVLPYFAATVRMGQYIGTRDSSPVILKRFNPKLFVRYTSQHFPKDGKSPDRYIDLEYAHESNGQSVDNAASFQAIASTVGGTEHAKDYISRGWDYIGITAKRDLDKQNNWHIYANRKWYCGCLMQENVEENFSFEDPRAITSIRQVSGWKAMVTYKKPANFVDRAALILDTGTRDTFQYNTARIEIGFRYFNQLFGVPIVAWYQNGYLSDLAQYYKKVHSYGLAFRFETRSEKL